MKKKSSGYRAFLFLFILLGSFTAYAGGHDSLTCDGYNDVIIFDGDNCYVEVTDVIGDVTGSRLEFKDMRACGGTLLQETWEKGQVKRGDKLKAGDSIASTFGTVFLKLQDGRIMMLGNNSSMIVSKDYCKGSVIGIELHYGYGAIDGKGSKGSTMNLRTKRGQIDIIGTQFSIESRGETDILRVYEGAVNFSKNMQNEGNITKAQDKGAEMKKLTEDFQAGKISIEEFTKKMQELQSSVTETLVPVKVTAGMESRIEGTEIPTVPASFDAAMHPWGEDK